MQVTFPGKLPPCTRAYIYQGVFLSISFDLVLDRTESGMVVCSTVEGRQNEMTEIPTQQTIRPFRVVLKHDEQEVLSFETTQEIYTRVQVIFCVEPAYLFRYSPVSVVGEIVFRSFSDLVSIDVDVLEDLPR
jgi:hypothetical protein